MTRLTTILLLLGWATVTYGQQVKVQLHSIVGYGQHEAFAKKAIVALEQVLNSEEFKQGVLTGSFIRTEGLSNQQLYDRIMGAHETQGPGGQDNVVDLRVRTLRVDGDESRWKDNCEGSTIGIDGNGDGVTAICPNKLEAWANQNRIDQLAGHYAHEYMHILGFSHYNRLRGQAWREKTFVYKIGNLVVRLVKASMQQ